MEESVVELLKEGKSLQYWEGVPSSVDGVLGGFPEVSVVDLKGNEKLIRSIKSLPPAVGGPCEFGCVLDGGAGIGRVTKGVLLRHFKKVDLLEPVEKHLETAKIFVCSANVEKYLNITLQQFDPEAGRYDCFWLQWCVLYCTDEELTVLLKLFKLRLRNKGLIVVKDNVVLEGRPFVDESEGSVIRQKNSFLKIFKDAGLRVLITQRQTGFPENLYPVLTWVLR